MAQVRAQIALYAPHDSTVLVTGAAKRLGRVIALGLARHGWQVAVHYRDSHDEALETAATCAELAGDSAALDADFFNEDSVRSLVPRAVAHFGHLDAVVNNASLFEHDDAGSFSYVALEAHLRSNTGAPQVRTAAGSVRVSTATPLRPAMEPTSIAA